MDGAAYSRTTYARLFAAIGILGGPGDGSTTFNVPDWRGLVPVGLKATDTDFDTIGKTGGVKSVTPAAHGHTLSGHAHVQQGTFTSDGPNALTGLVQGGPLPVAVSHSHNTTIGGFTSGPDTDGTSTFTPATQSVVQPYGVVGFYIST
jgi:microcystin-dependent protein